MAGCNPVMSESFRTFAESIRIFARAFERAEYWSSGITIFKPSFPPFSCTRTRTRFVSVAVATSASRNGDRP
jgi:hypothetical protein